MSWLAMQPEPVRAAILNRLSDRQLRELLHDWEYRARPEQLPPPGNWRVWVLLAGRGAGKTRAGAEWCRRQINAGCMRLALVAPTAADARDVMVEGESGILSVFPPDDMPDYMPSRRRLTWSSGAQATMYSAEEPERLRGPQHDGAWCDELCAWRYPEAWDQLMFTLRLGTDPRCFVSTTPKPTRLIKDLVARHGQDVVITRGTTYDNLSNLAPGFAEQIIRRYEGTRLGRQELMAEILDDVEGALWRRDMLDALRLKRDQMPALLRIVVGVDPAVTATSASDQTGIVVAGIDNAGNGYVLGDHTVRATPDAWARKIVEVAAMYGADRVVCEVNQGGDLVSQVLRTVDANLPIKKVHAQRGKFTRAEPVAALYEQGRVHHVGMLADLEDQMCSWIPGDPSPDRMDALVWAMTELMLKSAPTVAPLGMTRPSPWVVR